MELNVLQPFGGVGRNVLMWSGQHVGRQNRIGDNRFIASHPVISGNRAIGGGRASGRPSASPRAAPWAPGAASGAALKGRSRADG
jgi:hypothetical protein